MNKKRVKQLRKEFIEKYGSDPRTMVNKLLWRRFKKQHNYGN